MIHDKLHVCNYVHVICYLCYKLFTWSMINCTYTTVFMFYVIYIIHDSLPAFVRCLMYRPSGNYVHTLWYVFVPWWFICVGSLSYSYSIMRLFHLIPFIFYDDLHATASDHIYIRVCPTHYVLRCFILHVICVLPSTFKGFSKVVVPLTQLTVQEHEVCVGR